MKNPTKHLLVVALIFFNCVEGAMEGNVVGGVSTEIQKYPHSVFLDGRCRAAGHWICGSAVLNQRILLTAAHCVTDCDWKNDDKTRLVAYAGHENLSEVSIKRKIMDVRIHEDFNIETMENDIAVAKVRRDFPLGDYVKRIIITPTFPEVLFGFVSGWGIIKDLTEETSITLRHVKQKLKSPEICAIIGKLHDGMFCAGCMENVDRHPAKGDSGNALVTRSRFHQIGLVSFCIKKYPALMVYTNTSYYYEWVVKNSQNLYCDQ